MDCAGKSPRADTVKKKMHCGRDSGLFALLSFLAVQFVYARENLPPRFLSKTSSTRLATLPYRGRQVLVSDTKSGAPTQMFVMLISKVCCGCWGSEVETPTLKFPN